MNLKTSSSTHTEKFLRCARRFLPSIAAAAFFGLTAANYGINASPEPITVSQPDGTRITLRGRGDEFTHWLEDMNGFAVVHRNGQFFYARRRADGGLEATGLRVGRDNPRAAGLPEKLRPTPQFLRSERQRLKANLTLGSNGQISTAPAPASATISRIAPSGTVKNLVILCRFSDHTLGVHTRATADYDKLMNAVGGDPVVAPTGSLKDYYREVSYGACTVESTVIAWVTLPRTEAYYANGQDGFGSYPQNAQRMVEDALNAADSLVNFGQFDTDNDGFVDAIDIIHSGYAAETGGNLSGNWIWSHKWSLFQLPGGLWTSADRNSNNVPVKVFDYHTEAALWDVRGTNMLRVGVVAHETGHFFGLPDLYDTDGSSEGAGSWCLMANSWGFDFTQYHPPHPSAWARIQLGWVTPLTISPGTYNAPRVETVPTVYRITNGYPSGEYLLIENRQPVGFESDMPQGGLAIWHIDDAKDGNNEEGYPGSLGWPSRHYQVGLLQADGSYGLERGLNRGDAGDVYRSGFVSFITPTNDPNTHSYQSGVLVNTTNSIVNISASASNMTFTYVNPSAPTSVGIAVVALDATLIGESCTPTNRAIDPGETVSVSFRLRNVGQTNVNVTATLLPNPGVLAPSAPQTYTLSSNGSPVAKTFTYTASGECGASISNVLRLQVGNSNVGTVSFSFPLGAQVTRLSQNFDRVTAPALPADWTSTSTGLVSTAWVTASGRFTTPPNSAFINDPATITDSRLLSPSFPVSSTNAQLSFTHRYSTEYGFDGGVLEISVNGGAFADIIAAGGTFVTNGYNFFLDNGFGSPLAGRDAWTGDSGTNFITTTVKLPQSAANQSVRLRWRSASDANLAAEGWWVDSISLTELACCRPANLPLVLRVHRQGGTVVFSYASRLGVYYAIDYKDALADSWTLLTMDVGNGSTRSITNNITGVQRFFRLREL